MYYISYKCNSIKYVATCAYIKCEANLISSHHLLVPLQSSGNSHTRLFRPISEVLWIRGVLWNSTAYQPLDGIFWPLFCENNITKAKYISASSYVVVTFIVVQYDNDLLCVSKQSSGSQERRRKHQKNSIVVKF